MRPTETPTTADAPAIDARPLADAIITAALQRGASDIHVEPTASGCDIRLRIDGVLITERSLDQAAGRALALRLMVMAKLLTYRPDVPQEGRAAVVLPAAEIARPLELRVSMMPTTHGPRIAVRMPADLQRSFALEDLSLPDNVCEGLKQFAAGDAGMLIVTGPAGSGKTTTLYALLQYIVQTTPGLSVITLEDPVERDLPGVTQIEVTPFGERTYERCLRSILRQDPQVLMLGEIRDAVTASLAVQAALSGHRLLCTLHASTAGGAIARLIEMNVEPYQLTSSLWGILSQRLVRRKSADGYSGRVPLAELATLTPAVRAAVLQKADREELQATLSATQGFRSIADHADDLVHRGVTDSAELNRVGIKKQSNTDTDAHK